ncbi:MAG: cytochrome P450 [bacterium]|nr:cytochrome P450 [bacterium]
MTIQYPAQLDEDFDYFEADRPDLVDQLRRHRETRPAAWVKAWGQPALMFTSYELVDAAFRDEETFPSAAFYGTTVTDVLGRNIQCMEGTEHRRNRALVSPYFRAKNVAEVVPPLLEPVAHELIDRFEAAGKTDLVASFTKVYPIKIILRLLGLPLESEDDVARWAMGMMDIQHNFELAVQCSMDFRAFVTPVLERRRVAPGEDLLSQLASVEIEGERLSNDEIMNFLLLLFPAGADTTFLGLGTTLFALLTHPEQLEYVRSVLNEECRWAAEEAIRWVPPVSLQPRRNAKDVVWRDIPIPAGANLIFATLAGNRDPAAYEDPDRFDVRRRPKATLTFGRGPHFCLGAHLARAEMEVAVRVLLERLPRLRLVEGSEARITSGIVPVFRGPNRLPVRFD